MIPRFGVRIDSQTVATNTGLVLENESHLEDNFDRAWSIPAPANARLTVLGQFGHVLLPRFTIDLKRIFRNLSHTFQFRNIRKRPSFANTFINMSDNGESEYDCGTSSSSDSTDLNELLESDHKRNDKSKVIDLEDGEGTKDDGGGKPSAEERGDLDHIRVTQSSDDEQPTVEGPSDGPPNVPNEASTSTDATNSTNSAANNEGMQTRRSTRQNTPEAEVLKQYDFPNIKMYHLGDKVTFSNIPYQSSACGLGINICREPYTSVLVTEEGDSFRFNEPKGSYGQLVVKLIIDAMKKGKRKAKGKRIGERDYFDVVVKHQVDILIERAGYCEEKITSRQLDLTWKVWKGFNTNGDHNVLVRNLCTRYALIRLGNIPHHGDELRHAIHAVQDYYIEVTKDNSNPGTGQWTLPILHLMNQHIEHYLNIPKIQFHPSERPDKEAHVFRRASNKKIWIHDDNQGRIKVSVEKRPIAVEQLLAFVNDGVAEADQVAMAQDLGPPDGALPTRSNKKRRRSIDDE